MADRTVPPTNQTLRAAGLLPKELPRHRIARGENVPGQPGPVSQVFGPVEVENGRTSMRVASMRQVRPPDSEVQQNSVAARMRARGIALRHIRKQVAVIEVDATGVHIRAVQAKVPLLLVGVLLGAWNTYWIVRALREWRTGT
ncbi:MAG: hypothetical protein M3437_15500 [Chloroflexota bacterium]|nr:hypothetical protein [Chloroflexota bacterium]MDQ5865869.1 hypothetical protein [Chloroflexota bacterium]